MTWEPTESFLVPVRQLKAGDICTGYEYANRTVASVAVISATGVEVSWQDDPNPPASGHGLDDVVYVLDRRAQSRAMELESLFAARSVENNTR